MNDQYVDEAPPDDPYAPVERPDGDAMIEQQVIGAVLAHPHTLKDVQREIVPGDFQDMRLGVIWRGILQMVSDGAPISYLSVWDKLPDWDVHGIAITDLSRWADEATNSGAGVYYAGLVRDRSMRRLLADVGDRLRNPDTEIGVTLARAAEDLRNLTHVGGKSAGVRWLRDVLDVPEQDDAYDWVIPDVLERQDRLMLSAAEGAGKSTLLRQLAILSAAGIHPFRFTPMPPVNVLIVDAENSERQWRRASREMVQNAAERGRRDPRGAVALHTVGVMDITRANDLGQIHRWMDESHPDLVVLGPLYRMTAKSLNTDDDVAPVLAALDSIRERDVAMLIEVHAGHARSTSGERELRPRGSSALLGWPEFGLGLRRDKTQTQGRSTYSLVRWRGDRDQREWPRLVRGTVWKWEPTVQLGGEGTWR